MLRYLLEKFVSIILELVMITIFLFFFYLSLPGNFTSSLGPMDIKIKMELKHQLHLDEPKAVQFKYWLAGVAKGNMGYSFELGMPVGPVIKAHLIRTLMLTTSSFIVALLIAIPIGVKSAVKKYSLFDNFFSTFSLIGISIPAFAIAVVLKFVFTYNDTVFTIFTKHPKWNFKAYTENMSHYILPVFILIILYLAPLVKYIRSSMLEVLHSDYIKTARSKGLKERTVIYRHAFKNAFPNVLTVLGLSIPALFSGSFFVETVLGFPGVGSLFFNSIFMRDYPLMMGLTLTISIVIILTNFIIDFCYRLVDPRIRLA